MFRDWMREVNAEVIRIAGLSAADLADFDYRDRFDAGEDPVDVARELLEEEGFPFDEEDEDF